MILKRILTKSTQNSKTQNYEVQDNSLKKSYLDSKNNKKKDILVKCMIYIKHFTYVTILTETLHQNRKK